MELDTELDRCGNSGGESGIIASVYSGGLLLRPLLFCKSDGSSVTFDSFIVSLTLTLVSREILLLLPVSVIGFGWPNVSLEPEPANFSLDDITFL